MSSNLSTLTSLAMLKVNYDFEQRDYLDYLVPFVLHLLAKSRSTSVKDVDIADQIAEEFGMRIPVRIAQLVLKRLIRKGILHREHEVYHVKSLPALTDKSFRITEANRISSNVLRAMAEFAKQRHGQDWTDEHAQNSLLSFLSKFSIDCLKTYISGTTLPQLTPAAETDLFIVSVFIENASRTDERLFSEVIAIVKGHMLANALTCPDVESIQRKYERINFLLDTPFIIRLIGLHGDVDRRVANELVELIKRLRGRISVFKHTVEEVNNVIVWSENNLSNLKVHNRIVDEMRSLNRTKSDLVLLRAGLDDALSKHDIRIEPTPKYIEEFQIDESVLEGIMDDIIGYINPKAKGFDINSIRSIYALRRGKSPSRLEDAGAVLVTTNSELAAVAFRYGQKYEATREVSSVITDFSLANISWIKSPFGAPNLPMYQLMSTCYAIMSPSEELWTRYLTEVDRLRQRGSISATEHEFLRMNLKAKDELMNLTLGDERELTSLTLNELIDKFRKELTKDKDGEISRLSLENEQLDTKNRELQDRVRRWMEEMSRIKSGIYWKCVRQAWIYKWLLSSAMGLVYVILSYFSSLVTNEFVLTSPLLALFATGAFFLICILGALNLIVGMTLNGFLNKIEERILKRLYVSQVEKMGLDGDSGNMGILSSPDSPNPGLK